MKLRFFLLITICFIFIAGYNFILHPFYSSVPVTAQTAALHKVLLVPLDTRPPCRQFVINAGRIADTAVLTPPHEILDYYSQPGDTKAIMQWLDSQMDDSGAVILSIDQLLYGGLLAARETDKSPEELEEFLSSLQELHNRHPAIPIYAFSILPRITPPDSIDGYEEKKLLMRYSRLLDKLSQQGQAASSSELDELVSKIPPASLQKYKNLFEKNARLNKHLSLMASQGVLTRLIIGQDDGETYGIPNMEKRTIQTFLASQAIPESRVCITHGADEIALTLLAEIRTKTAMPTRVYLAYNDSATPSLVMPYMASTVSDTAQEKLRMLGCIPVSRPDEADFILYISCGTRSSLSSRLDNTAQLQKWINEGQKIALVDLSEHFQAQEVLFPFLLQENLPLHALIAYAGWNTASNSIGTALAQALLYDTGLRQASDKNEVLRLCQANLTFLDNRYLEDYYYLKDVIEQVDTSLRKAGYKNVNDLDLEHNYLWSNAMLREAMKQRIQTYKNTRSFREPVAIHAPAADLRLRVRDLTADMSYPWPRTFEIHLDSVLHLDLLPE